MKEFNKSKKWFWADITEQLARARADLRLGVSPL